MHRNWLLGIAAVAFLLRLAASGSLRNPDVWETETIARNLVERHAYVFKSSRAYSEPMHPFVVAAVYLVTNENRTAVVLLQILVSAATVWLVGRLATSATGEPAAGIVAASLMAVDPGLIRYSAIIHPVTFDVFFFAAAALAIVERRVYLAAALIGLGALTRPTILLFLLPLFAIRRTVLIFVIALAIVAPWTIRNAVVFHHFVFTRSGTGFVFWLGNNPNATGGSMDVHGRPLLRDAPPEFQARVRAAGELERDRIFRQAAFDYIAAKPLAAVGRVAQRIYYFWWFSPEWGPQFSPRVKIIYRLWWAFLLLLFALGAFASRALPPPRRRDVWLLVAMALLISFVQSLYYVEGRHRLPAEALILPMAGCGALAPLAGRGWPKAG